MNAVRFFFKDLPVRGDAPVIEFDDGPHKVWMLVMPTPDGERVTPMREKVGEVTLQQRFDYYLRHECRAEPAIGFADHFEPATPEIIDYWMSGHKKRYLA